MGKSEVWPSATLGGSDSQMLYRDFMNDDGSAPGTMHKMLKKIADMENEKHRLALSKTGNAKWRADLAENAERQLDLGTL